MKFASATLDDSCTHHLGHKSTSRATLVTALLCLGLFVVPATAKTVTVNCVGSTINAALKTLDPKADNTVRVIGSCNESIGVNGFADLTILGVNAGGKIPMILPPDGTAAF